MASNYYVTTAQSGTLYQVLVHAAAGTNVESADLAVVIAGATGTFTGAVGPIGWSTLSNPTNGLVGMFDTTFSSPVGASAGGVLVTLNFTLPTASTVLSGTVTVEDYSDINENSFGASPSLPLSAAAPCFASGTRIATPYGARAVEALRVGDLVLTASGHARPVVWVGDRVVDCRRHSRPQSVVPVRIKANAFAPGLPCRDLLLSPDHAVFAGGVLIPVKYLADGRTVAFLHRCRRVHYFHIELDRHDIVLAEGLTVESFLDTGNRGMFDRGGPTLALHPDFSRCVWEAQGCAPLVVAGPAVTALRDHLQNRARQQQPAAPRLAAK